MKLGAALQQIDRTYVLKNGRKLSYFAGCDYFRLSSHPAILRAMHDGLERFGLNVAASRITTGNHKLYGEVEKGLAHFFQAPAALLVSSGYATNGVVAQALRGQFTHVFLDAKAHVSLRDAAPLFGCPIVEFKSRDAGDLARHCRQAGKQARPILLTDGVFTYESQVAPLAEYMEALGREGIILLDDAHGAGVLGGRGRGTIELAGVARSRVIQTITLSKAFGVYGGAILCSAENRAAMVERSTMFAGSTPLPLPLIYAAEQSIKILSDDKKLRARLNRNVEKIKIAFNQSGRTTPLTPVPVVAITPNSDAEAARLKKRLLAANVLPSFIKYPGGPADGYLRLVISSEHTDSQLDALIEAVCG